MDTADILEKAAEVLETRGWCQGTYQNDRGEVCAVGALRVARFGVAKLSATSEEIKFAQYTQVNDAMRAVAAQVGLTRWENLPPEWNDQPERTKEEVIDAFKHAAKDLRNNKEPS